MTLSPAIGFPEPDLSLALHHPRPTHLYLHRRLCQLHSASISSSNFTSADSLTTRCHSRYLDTTDLDLRDQCEREKATISNSTHAILPRLEDYLIPTKYRNTALRIERSQLFSRGRVLRTPARTVPFERPIFRSQNVEASDTVDDLAVRSIRLAPHIRSLDANHKTDSPGFVWRS